MNSFKIYRNVTISHNEVRLSKGPSASRFWMKRADRKEGLTLTSFIGCEMGESAFHDRDDIIEREMKVYEKENLSG